MIINQRFLQIVESIIIRLISDNKGGVITRCLCALSIVCVFKRSLLGVKICLSHAQIGLL